MTDDQAWEAWMDIDPAQREYDEAVIKYNRLRRNQTDVGPLFGRLDEAEFYARRCLHEIHDDPAPIYYGIRSGGGGLQVYRQG